ncbi:DNA polymerase/primase [Mycobacterium phage KristaRAM]|nr:DNA polymerase/primase [Mycobacterium phage Krakatau]YP_009958954.1 DNA polymerase/primase [Mycobacterium phage KristaRAM]YP_009959771.1 DNA polymerase/primase [Mycobacterium phage MinionDave]YP_009960376.1 DNA polymerase/primase [Mycobacterium phage Nitzel]QUE26187.1 hypothetical protein SEA_AKHILA_1 [Mycobacterium phage Akhila]UAJ16603.1 HNH endonuclease [Mycobacterium phage MilanaBonita]AXH69776.1 hypothetical protein SEA_KRAKATAU_1 [Mycobacterium phage Krakatau]AXQ64058.1 hypothetical
MNVRGCERCGAKLGLGGARGRSPRFCSGRCRVAAHRNRTRLPESLTSRPRWTCRDGKRPIQPNGRPASSTNSATWSTWAEVKDCPNGIMLGDGLACYDLDGVLDDGKLLPEFVELFDRISADALWVERSMSGRGLHVFVAAPEAPAQVGAHVSFYSFGRFIAVTGDRFK